MKVGFVGLGTMGGHMAFNCLQGGNDLIVHDINQSSATRHLEAGADWADTPKQVAEQSEVVSFPKNLSPPGTGRTTSPFSMTFRISPSPS